MLINSPNISGSLKVTGNTVITGSLTVLGGINATITGSATTASYVEYSNVANKPTLVSGSSQVTYSGLTGVPSGIVSGSSQITYSGISSIPSGIVSGSSQVSFNGIADKPSLVSGSEQISFNGITDKPTLVSGSSQITYSGLSGIPSGIVSGSAQIVGYNVFATTGSNVFQANQVITGSLFISQNLVVAGSSSIQYISSSVVDIADNIITVNAFNPGVRFGGLAVADSGSSPRVSGSILFDSIKDQWIFVHESSATTSSVLLMGPETYNDLGNETYLSANRLPKGSGIEHLRDSNITDTGTNVSINSNTQVTGSFTVVTGSAVELQVTNTGVNIGSIPTDNHNVTGSLRVTGSMSVAPSITITGDGSNDIFKAVRSGVTRVVIKNGVNTLGINTDTINNPLTVNGGADFSGNVGIGTNSPSTTLHLNSTSTQLTLQNVDGGTNAERVGMFMTSGDTFKILSLNDNNTTRTDNILVANVLNGNVGIGTNSPTYRTEVALSVSAYWTGTAFTGGNPSALSINNTTNGGYDSVLLLQQTDSGGTTKLAGGIGLVGTGPWTAGDNATQISDMYFLVRNSSGGISERMRIKSSGNVGIGLTNPGAILDVSHTAGTTNIIRVSNGAGNYRWRIDQLFSMIMTNASNVDTFSVNTSGAGYFAGSVGIGNDSPVTRLTLGGYTGSRLPYINGTGATFGAGGITVTSTNSGNAAIGGGLDLTNNTYSVNAYSPIISFSSRSSSGDYNNSYAGIWGQLLGPGGDANWVVGALVFGTASSYGITEQMRIRNDGNVGIGLTNPGEKLSINAGNIKMYTLQNVADQYSYIGTEYSPGNGNNRAEIRFAIDGSDTNTRLTFHTANGGGTINERMRITSGGNVGIGTTSITNGTTFGGGGQINRLKVQSTNYTCLEINGSTSGGSVQFTYGTNLPNQVAGLLAYNYANGAANEFAISNILSGPLIFATSNTERMRITSGGQIQINGDTGIGSNSKLQIIGPEAGPTFKNETSGQQSLFLWNSATSGNNLFIEFGTEGAGSLAVRGSIDYNRAAGLVRYNTTSDKNLKNIIGDSNKQKSIDILSSTKIREFSWKNDEINKSQIGVIAQELYETYKGAVSEGSSDELLGTEDYKPWRVDKTAFTFHLIAGFQEHEKIIKELQSQIETLKSKIEILEQS